METFKTGKKWMKKLKKIVKSFANSFDLEKSFISIRSDVQRKRFCEVRKTLDTFAMEIVRRMFTNMNLMVCWWRCAASENSYSKVSMLWSFLQKMVKNIQARRGSENFLWFCSGEINFDWKLTEKIEVKFNFDKILCKNEHSL